MMYETTVVKMHYQGNAMIA